MRNGCGSEAAARRESFAKAAEELNVSSSAVAHRIKVLEQHLHGALFERGHRGVRLNGRGKAYLKDVQRILAELRVVTERRRGDSGTQRLKLVSVEAVAEKWLMPRLADFKLSHPGVVIELETNHRGVDPARRGFDMWITYVGETAAPRPEGLFEETLYEEDLLPVCSPALIEARGRPVGPVDLHDWPLLYDLGWDTDWPYWFSRQGAPSPDLSRAVGLPPLQHGGRRRGGGHRHGYRTLEGDRAGDGTGRAGPSVRAAGRSTRAVLPHHDSRLEAQSGSSGIPGLDTEGGLNSPPGNRTTGFVSGWTGS